MIKTIVLFTWLGIFLVLNCAILPLWLLFFFLGMRGARRRLMRIDGKFWARHFLFLLGAKIIVEGKENMPADDRVCLISNHQSLLDILVIMGFSGKVPGFIAKKELIYAPLLNFWMLLVHCVFIDRRSVRKSALAIDRGAASIKRGNPMVIFPEGTRGKDGEIAPFKAGSLKLATRSGALIVPLTMINTASLFERTLRLRADTVRMVIHPQIPTEGLSKEERIALPDIVRKHIVSAFPAGRQEDDRAADQLEQTAAPVTEEPCGEQN